MDAAARSSPDRTSPGGPLACTVDGLSVRYRGTGQVLDDLSMALPAGSVTALIGPNGVGKSTLLRTIAGFERPTSGRVRVDGVDVHGGGSAARGSTGFLPQRVALYPASDARAHIAWAAAARPGYDRGIPERMLRDLDVPMDRRTDRISGGQRVIVALALVLGTRPALLLLDEPTEAMDPLVRLEVYGLIRDLAQRYGTSVLVATHQLAEATAAADRFLVLGGGRITLDGDAPTLLATHRTIHADAPLPPGAAWVAAVPGGGADRRVVIRIDPDRPVAGDALTLDDLLLAHLAALRSATGPAVTR